MANLCAGVPCSLIGPGMWLTMIEVSFMIVFHSLWLVEILFGVCIAFANAALVAVVALSLEQAKWTFSSVMGVNVAVSKAMKEVCYGTADDDGEPAQQLPSHDDEDLESQEPWQQQQREQHQHRGERWLFS